MGGGGGGRGSNTENIRCKILGWFCGIANSNHTPARCSTIHPTPGIATYPSDVCVHVYISSLVVTVEWLYALPRHNKQTFCFEIGITEVVMYGGIGSSVEVLVVVVLGLTAPDMGAFSSGRDIMVGPVWQNEPFMTNRQRSWTVISESSFKIQNSILIYLSRVTFISRWTCTVSKLIVV